MVRPDSTGIPRAPAYLGVAIWRAIPFAYGTFTPCGQLSQHCSARYGFCNSTTPLRQCNLRSRYPSARNDRSLARAWFRLYPLSLTTTQGISCRFLFLRLLRCFTSPGSPRLKRVTGLLPAGFPHSGISGSMAACASPKLFAACHALLRPLVPRHPPCTLSTLTSLISFIHIQLSMCSPIRDRPEPPAFRGHRSRVFRLVHIQISFPLEFIYTGRIGNRRPPPLP